MLTFPTWHCNTHTEAMITHCLQSQGKKHLGSIRRAIKPSLVVLLQSGLCIIYAFAVEAHPVDDCILHRQPEQPWLIIAWLWLRK
jgi:hypothetical protein